MALLSRDDSRAGGAQRAHSRVEVRSETFEAVVVEGPRPGVPEDPETARDLETARNLEAARDLESALDLETAQASSVAAEEPGHERWASARQSPEPAAAPAAPAQEEWTGYSLKFKLFVVVSLAVSSLWAYSVVILVPQPSDEDGETQVCSFTKDFPQFRAYHPHMVLIYYLGLVMARSLLFLPFISWRVAGVYRSRTSKPWQSRCLRAFFDVPVYHFLLGAWILWTYLLLSSCAERNPHANVSLILWATLGEIVSAFALALTVWQNMLLRGTIDTYEEFQVRKVRPMDLVTGLRECSYDADQFGDEVGKPYPSVCPICLADWEESEVIVITSCEHAFHKECLWRWLRKARTCVMCRQDLTKPPTPKEEGGMPAGQEDHQELSQATLPAG